MESVASYPSPLYCVLSHLIGGLVTVTLKDGRFMTGLLSYETLLQMDARILLIELGKDNTGKLHFETVRVLLSNVSNIKGSATLKSGPLVSTSFKTDTSISNKQRSGERELERWQVDDSTSGVDYSLSSSKNEKWDQFSANQRLFGIQTSFDEHEYTTALNKNTPEYQARIQEAEKIARDIESRFTLNANESARPAEEPEQEEDLDEEALFSEVKRSTSASKLNINAAEFIPQSATPEKPARQSSSYYHQPANYHTQPQPYYGTVYFNQPPMPMFYPSMPHQPYHQYYYYDDSDL